MMPDDVPSDLGATGPAATARKSRVVTIEGRSGGSGNAPTVAVQARRYECECRLDLMRSRGLDPKLFEAGMTFRHYWLACRQPQRVTAGYTEQMGGRATPGVLSVAALEFWAEARGRLRQAFEVLTVPQRLAVIGVCGEDEPVGEAREDTLRRGLVTLADVWCRDMREACR